MKLPFSADQFFGVFHDYNETVWPVQVILLGIAIVIPTLVILRYKWSDTIAGIILTALWLWMGIVYHLLYFVNINPAAKIFGVFFIAQGLIFCYTMVLNRKIHLVFQPGLRTGIGSFFILFALLIYPLLGAMFGHVYPDSPTFGLPCPTTIFTFGVLLWSEKRIPIYIILIPLLWSVIGFTASFTMGIWEDTGLLVSGLIFIGFHFNTLRSK